MKEQQFSKILQPTASEIAASLSLSEQALSALDDSITPQQYLSSLIDNELLPDAILFLATALPKREGTWWACLCARAALGDKPSEHDLNAVVAAETWVYKPIQQNCKLAYPAADATEYKTPPGWAAMAAFWSGDDISPVAESVIPPPDDLTAKAVNGAVMLASVSGKADQIGDRQRRFLQQGIDIACGGDGRLSEGVV